MLLSVFLVSMVNTPWLSSAVRMASMVCPHMISMRRMPSASRVGFLILTGSVVVWVLVAAAGGEGLVLAMTNAYSESGDIVNPSRMRKKTLELVKISGSHGVLYSWSTLEATNTASCSRSR